jgi:hypothetical protein
MAGELPAGLVSGTFTLTADAVELTGAGVTPLTGLLHDGLGGPPMYGLAFVGHLLNQPGVLTDTGEALVLKLPVAAAIIAQLTDAAARAGQEVELAFHVDQYRRHLRARDSSQTLGVECQQCGRRGRVQITEPSELADVDHAEDCPNRTPA